ncbi:MAG TPA: RNA methyltransferase [Polyangiaceae bacterium]|nr:RNA methyltransferase [Polyangiaceae bacterium]
MLYGLRSGLAVFERRPGDIRRIGFDAALRAELAELQRWAAGAGVPCREEDERELAARAQSSQHEGLVLDVLPRRWLPARELVAELAQSPGVVVALDRVRNPQNVGAVLRSAAFFGVKAVILGAPAPHPGLPPFALRVAEGGAEHLAFCRTTDLADTLARLRSEGIPIIGADAHATGGLDTIEQQPSRVLVLGHEREGLGPRIKAQCSALVTIQGSGALDSLNVAVAAGVLLAELWRHSSAAARPARSTGAREHRR